MLPKGAAKDVPVDVPQRVGLELHLSYFRQGVFERNVGLELEPVQVRLHYFLIEGFAVVRDPSACTEGEHAFDGLFWTEKIFAYLVDALGLFLKGFSPDCGVEQPFTSQQFGPESDSALGILPQFMKAWDNGIAFDWIDQSAVGLSTSDNADF